MERLLKMNPKLNNHGGIYFLTREDENGFKYAYIGQSCESVGVLRRIAQHMSIHGNPQHIDLSIAKHKMYSVDNPYGWKAGAMNFPDSELDKKEKYYIKLYADKGYQLRNVSLGGQGNGRNMINDTKPSRGFRDGILSGKKSLAKDLKHLLDIHLTVSIKPEKANNKVSQRALEKFNELLDEENYKEG